MNIDWEKAKSATDDQIAQLLGGQTSYYWFRPVDGCAQVIVMASSLETAINAMQKCSLQSPDMEQSMFGMAETINNESFAPLVNRMSRVTEVGES